MTREVLVIGGTGMLAGAVRHIARRAARVTLIARDPEALAHEIGAHALPMDWTDRTAVANALATLRAQEPPDLMISWIHRPGLWCLAAFEELLPAGGRSLRVHGFGGGRSEERDQDRSRPASTGDPSEHRPG